MNCDNILYCVNTLYINYIYNPLSRSLAIERLNELVEAAVKEKQKGRRKKHNECHVPCACTKNWRPLINFKIY